MPPSLKSIIGLKKQINKSSVFGDFKLIQEGFAPFKSIKPPSPSVINVAVESIITSHNNWVFNNNSSGKRKKKKKGKERKGKKKSDTTLAAILQWLVRTRPPELCFRSSLSLDAECPEAPRNAINGKR